MKTKSVNRCVYQVVFCVKYKKEVLIGDIRGALESLLYELEEPLNMKVLQLKIEPYYVDLLIETVDSVAISKLIFQLKKQTAGKLKVDFPTLTTQLPNIWTGETYIKTIGEIDMEQVGLFLESQKKRTVSRK